MSTEPKGIVKLSKPTSPVKSATVLNYFFRNIEVLQSSINTSKLPLKIVLYITSTVVSLVIIFWLSIGNVTHQFYSFATELKADFHHQAVLSDYFKTMTSLLVEDNLKNNQQKSAIVRAMTQATLEELDPGRKRYVIMFLQDANLLQGSSNKQPSLLWGANLVGANLQGIVFKSTNLQGTNLAKADLRGTDLRGANLKSANLDDSCYDTLTLFERKFQPISAGMREITESDECAAN
jgi:Pentapeptide repeats (8 copies)